MDRLVGHRDMARAAIGVGIDRDGLDAQPPRRLDDPAGDLAAVGDQDLGEHQAAHFGLRLSRKALMPSSASSVTHWLATCSPRMSAASESCGRASISVTSFLTSGLHRRRAELQLAGQRRHRRVERVGLDDLVDQADAQRRRRIEHAAMHQELARHARADRLDQHRDGDAGQQAVAHRGQAEARRRGGDGEVAGQHQADAAAHRRAMDARDRRLGEVVDRLHRPHQGVGAGLARDGVELGPASAPS